MTDVNPSATPSKPRVRLIGIDAARGVALLGMIAVHVYRVAFEDAVAPEWMTQVLLGRSAALFAVLAGVGLALLTGGSRQVTAERASSDRRSIIGRAAVIAAVGLSVGLVESELEIILVQYAVMFLLALPFTTMPVRRLVAWAAGWTILSPVIALALHALLPNAGDGFWLQSEPNWLSFLSPLTMPVDLFLTGSYPVIQWFSYFLFGLIIGRQQLSSLRVQVLLIVGGIMTFLGVRLVSWFALYPGGGYNAIMESTGTYEPDVIQALQGDGSSLWWLMLDLPHAGTTPSLVDSMATSAIVLGVCLVIGRRWEKPLFPLAGAGAMTLTFYSAHLLVMALITRINHDYNETAIFWGQAAIALAIGAAFRFWGRRGPLEALAHWTAARARTLGRPARSAPEDASGPADVSEPSTDERP